MVQDPDPRDLSVLYGNFHCDISAKTGGSACIDAVRVLPVLKGFPLKASLRRCLCGRFIYHLLSRQGVFNGAQDASGGIGGAGDTVHLPGLASQDLTDHALCPGKEGVCLAGGGKDLHVSDLSVFHGDGNTYFSPIAPGGSGIGAVFIGKDICFDFLLFFLCFRAFFLFFPDGLCLDHLRQALRNIPKDRDRIRKGKGDQDRHQDGRDQKQYRRKPFYFLFHSFSLQRPPRPPSFRFFSKNGFRKGGFLSDIKKPICMSCISDGIRARRVKNIRKNCLTPLFLCGILRKAGVIHS